MKRSFTIQLAVLGALGFAFYQSSSDEPLHQQEYGSREECEQDWDDGESCSESSESHSGGGSSSGGGGGGNERKSRWKGPRYYWDRDLGKPVEVRQDGTTRVIERHNISSGGSWRVANNDAGSLHRGGFGSSARGFSLGG